MAGSAARPLLLFDLGGVLIENVGPERLRHWMPVPVDIDEIKRRWLASSWVRRFEAGRIDAAAFASGLVDDWALRCEPARFLDDFAGWPQGLPARASTLLAALRAVGPIGWLSNSNTVHWDRFDGFGDVFDTALSSHLSGFVKPDRRCFDHAVERCGVAADRILFFDDMVANVVASRAAGLQAIQVDGLEALIGALDERGLLPAQSNT